MKVIKKGKIKIRVCKTCKTKFSYEPEDIKLGIGAYVECPVCKKNIFLS